MRLTTEFFVSALVRRVFGSGGFAAVVRRGASEAGAVFVLYRGRFGGATLFGPAPQTSYDTARPDERLFLALEAGADEGVLEKRLEAEQSRFEVGLTTNFFVVQAQRDLRDAENVELRALADYRKSLVNFERAQQAPSGGGGGGGGTNNTGGGTNTGGNAGGSQ